MGTASEDPNRLGRRYRCVPERGIQGQMSDILSAPATMSLPQRVRSHGCCVLGWVHGCRETTIMHRVRFHLPGSVMGVPFPVGIGKYMATRGRPIPVGNETAGRALTGNAMEPSDAYVHATHGMDGGTVVARSPCIRMACATCAILHHADASSPVSSPMRTGQAVVTGIGMQER